MDNDSIKKNLLKIRLDRKLSQEEMADILGIARNTYRNIEKGKTRLLSETVMKVAEWAGMTPEEVTLGYTPSETEGARLRDIRESYNYRVKSITEEYEARLDALRKENGLLKELLKEKDDNIRNLKSLVALLEKRAEDGKND